MLVIERMLQNEEKGAANTYKEPLTGSCQSETQCGRGRKPEWERVGSRLERGKDPREPGGKRFTPALQALREA